MATLDTTAKTSGAVGRFRLSDIPEKHPDDMTNFSHLTANGNAHYLSVYLGNCDTTIVSGERYICVAEHDDGHVGWNGRSELLEQFHGRICPGALLCGVVDVPGHGNGATAVEDADDDGGGLVALESGVDGQCQMAGAPPGEYPAEQGREAESDVQSSPAGTGAVAAVVEPFSEILAQAVPSAPGGEGRDHGALTGAASENGSEYPQDQAGQLWLREVR